MEEKIIPEFRRRVQRIEELLGTIEGTTDPVALESARELAGTLLELHAVGLTELFDRIYEKGGQNLVDDLAGDETVGELLLLHGLHPLDLQTRVRNALQTGRPYLNSHDGDVELIDITPQGVVRLRLNGNCDGCPSSRLTIQSTIEEAIYRAAPEVTAIEVEGAEEDAPKIPSGFVPSSALGIPRMEEIRLKA